MGSVKIPFELLDNNEEFRRIKQSVKDANIKVAVTKTHGTVDNL